MRQGKEESILVNVSFYNKEFILGAKGQKTGTQRKKRPSYIPSYQTTERSFTSVINDIYGRLILYGLLIHKLHTIN